MSAFFEIKNIFDCHLPGSVFFCWISWWNKLYILYYFSRAIRRPIPFFGPFVGPCKHSRCRKILSLLSNFGINFFSAFDIYSIFPTYMYGLKSCSLLFWYKQFLKFKCCYLENDTMETIANFIRNCFFFFHFHQSKMKYSLKIIPLYKI